MKLSISKLDRTGARASAKHFCEVEAREKRLGQMWSKVDAARNADEKKWSEEKNQPWTSNRFLRETPLTRERAKPFREVEAREKRLVGYGQR